MSERATIWFVVIIFATFGVYIWARLFQAIFNWPYPALWVALLVAWTVVALGGTAFLVRRVRAYLRAQDQLPTRTR